MFIVCVWGGGGSRYLGGNALRMDRQDINKKLIMSIRSVVHTNLDG